MAVPVLGEIQNLIIGFFSIHEFNMNLNDRKRNVLNCNSKKFTVTPQRNFCSPEQVC